MLGPIFALFVEGVGGSLLDASAAGAAFALAAALTTLVAGRYTDKFRKGREVLILGYTLMGVGFICFVFVHSIVALLAVQVLIGFAEALYAPAFDALYSEHITARKVGREWGAWEAMSYFVHGFGAIAGGAVVVWLGFDWLFLLMSGMCFGVALYLLHLPRTVL